jgi:hypothetical protein
MAVLRVFLSLSYRNLSGLKFSTLDENDIRLSQKSLISLSLSGSVCLRYIAEVYK